MQNLYTTAEVAELLKIHEGTVWNWLRDGRPGGIDTVAGSRVQESDLEKWLEGQRRRKPENRARQAFDVMTQEETTR